MDFEHPFQSNILDKSQNTATLTSNSSTGLHPQNAPKRERSDVCMPTHRPVHPPCQTFPPLVTREISSPVLSPQNRVTGFGLVRFSRCLCQFRTISSMRSTLASAAPCHACCCGYGGRRSKKANKHVKRCMDDGCAEVEIQGQQQRRSKNWHHSKMKTGAQQRSLGYH